MKTLRYSQLCTPENLLVAESTRLTDGGVSARLVDLRDHHRQVAVISVGANGQVSLISDREQDLPRLRQFAGRCREADGQRLHRQIVWRSLAMEPLYARAVVEAERAGATKVAVRAFHQTGVITLHQVDVPGPDMGIDPHVFAPTVVLAQAWIADQWARVYLRRADRQATSRLMQLPHTGVWVPLAFPVRGELEEPDARPGQEGAMFVWIAGQPVGRVVHGGEQVRLIQDAPGARAVVERFTRVCCRAGGDGFGTKEELLEMLYTEERIAHALRRALGQGEHLVKVDAPDGVDLLQLPDRGAPGEPNYDQARVDALRELPPDAVGAELWCEHGWVPLPLSF